VEEERSIICFRGSTEDRSPTVSLVCTSIVQNDAVAATCVK
jgi:hypothetical protein